MIAYTFRPPLFHLIISHYIFPSIGMLMGSVSAAFYSWLTGRDYSIHSHVTFIGGYLVAGIFWNISILDLIGIGLIFKSMKIRSLTL